MMVEPAVAGPGQAALEAIAFGSVAVTTRALNMVGLDLTFAQWRVLVIVGESVDGATISEISVRLGSEVSAVSRLVTRMARRQLVAARKDERDRRITRVTAADRGLELRSAVLARRGDLIRDVLRAAGPIPTEAEDALDRITAAFSDYT